MKSDFLPFRVGTLFNSIGVNIPSVSPIKKKITIEYPSRLCAMPLDPSRLIKNENLVYTSGEIVFAINICRRVTVRVTDTKGELFITDRSNRKSLITHAFQIMQQALRFEESIEIDIVNPVERHHCGLGTSSGLIASIACAINELYGNPISRQNLAKYVAQNHGEEIDGEDNYINPVQCLGGSAAAGMFQGGVLVLSGEACVIARMNLAEDYQVIIGIPRAFQGIDSKQALDQEIKQFPKFLATGQKYAQSIAYTMLHECLPGLAVGNLHPLAELIYKYRFYMGSIENSSFIYPPILGIANSLKWLKEENFVDVLSLSSVGPALFAITTNPDICERSFSKAGLDIIKTTIYNETYCIIETE